MKYEYSYKTSDGERHVDFVTAKSVDDAFCVLRARGIRPMRVARAKPNGWIGRMVYFFSSVTGISVTVAFVSIVVAIVFAVRFEDKLEALDYASVKGVNFEKLINDVKLVRKAHEDAFKAVDFQLIRNYQLIAQVDDMREFYTEVAKARVAIDNTRERLRAIFSAVPKSFAGDDNGFAAAQALYGDVMGAVDADEAQVDADEAAIMLLDENRSQWKSVGGHLVFSDSGLKSDFEMLTQSVDPATARWRKDFGMKTALPAVSDEK